ncbi:MAG TPA: hypothetical protein VJ978_01300 [Nitriliruptoraceae bacterium]|nr:hypothetical protein [Nitriliruptoraceae bacterium]
MFLSSGALAGALGAEGFEVVSSRRGRVHLSRRVGHRDDHVVLEPASRGLVGLLPWRRHRVCAVVVGQVWRLVEQAFSRPVPAVPTLPSQVHVASRFDPSTHSDDGDVTRLVGAIVSWCDARATPADVLARGEPDDPVLRLEFAVVARDHAVGQAAAAEARAGVSALEPARRRMVTRRIDLAEDRLP